MRIVLVILADTFFNAWRNTSTLLLENTCVTPTVRETKIFGNNLPFLRNVPGIFVCLIYKMLFMREKKPELNTQSHSIKARLFGTQLSLSTLHIVVFLITNNKISHTFLVDKELTRI